MLKLLSKGWEKDRIEFHSGGEEDTRVLGDDRFVNHV